MAAAGAGAKDAASKVAEITVKSEIVGAAGGEAAAASLGPVLYGSVLPQRFPRAFVSIDTKLGRRKKQEDRAVCVPRIYGDDNAMFFGVFDGTVGDYAAEFVHLHAADAICGAKHLKEAMEAAAAEGSFIKPRVVKAVQNAIVEGYRATDAQLIRACAEEGGQDYTSCTSVTAIILGDLLSVAHLGDSKIVLGREVNGMLVGRYLTMDHKPDQPAERARIERSGGTLAYLHGGKPFIRGGDFTARQAKGERPMQLNYSRAFGGKDLKMFGLSAEPDIQQLQLTKADRVLILASDGLWDIATADDAVRRALEAFKLGLDPAADLVDYALAQHDLRGTVDNVTVTVAIFP